MTQATKNRGLLLVDTDVAFRDELSVALERFDVAIVWRARVKGLLETVAETNPLAVVLSADLPGSEPIELLRAIRAVAQASELAVYVVGSALARETVLRAYVEGADAVLIRDAAVAEITARVLGRTKRPRRDRRDDGRSVADAALDLCEAPAWPETPSAPQVADANPFVFTDGPGSAEAIADALAAAADQAPLVPPAAPPVQATPIRATPTQQAPVPPAPVQQAAGQQVLGHPVPGPSAPVQYAPVQPAPVQYAPVQPASVQHAPVQPAPVQPAPVQPPPVPFQHAPVEPSADPAMSSVPIGVSPPVVSPQPTEGAWQSFGVRPATPVAVPDVIIVEDDPSLLEMLRYALTNRGYQTLSLSNGLDALRALREMDTAGLKPVVLLDVDLPGIDGFRILHELAGSRPGVYQIILCTIHNSEATQVLGIQSGALDYLVKPLRMPIVLAKVEALIGHGSLNAAARGRAQ